MLLTNARLVDGRGVDLRIDGETIAAVETALDPRADESVRNIDGKLLLPGRSTPTSISASRVIPTRRRGQRAQKVRPPAGSPP
jgi:hypothetical protein